MSGLYFVNRKVSCPQLAKASRSERRYLNTGCIQPSDVKSVTLEEHKLVHAFVIEFADGTSRLYEAPKLLNDAPGFASAVNS